MHRIRITILLGFALACSTCGSGVSGAAAVVPGSYQIGTWKLVEEPVVAKDEADLYNRIDGGAPKYIERGWVGSAYADYQKGDRSLQVAVHDMGTPAGAEDLFRRDLPVAHSEISYTDDRDPAGRRPNAVVNQSLSTNYAANAFSNRYYIEANIDAKTDAALEDLKAFVLEMLDRAR